MKMKKTILLFLILSLSYGVVFAAMGQHTLRHLGNPRTSFCRPPSNKPEDVRKMLQSKLTDIRIILEKRGWHGKIEDLAAAIPSAEITETSIAPGTTIPFMAVRHRGKPDYIDNVVWKGPKPFPAYQMTFTSNGYDITLFVPKPCGNFWIEEKPSEKPSQPVQNVPAVSVSTSDVCVTQTPTLQISVENATPGSHVQINVDGQNAMTVDATNGSMEKQLPPYQQPGTHNIEVTLDGAKAPATTTLNVKPCPPTCALTVTPTTGIYVRAPFAVDATGSAVASGVTVGLKSVTVEILKDGKKVDGFDLTAPNLKREDVAINRAGQYTIRAVATDAAGQSSSNACEAQVEVKAPFFMAAGFVGKERMIRDEFPNGRCAALIGGKFGITPQLSDNVDLELSAGGKINLRDSDNSAFFVDAAIQRVFNKGFIGGGVSAWDLNLSDTRTIALLAQFGIDLSKDHRVQFVVEGRAPFDKFDDLDNNYQFWGGIRFRWAK
ncbi:MAG: hypothetical protein C5B54_07425 [Acidobacteria bacterium]|nr:MAG: hypothetical protein C5B54_07425 [Acidobacteriota bacterium]